MRFTSPAGSDSEAFERHILKVAIPGSQPKYSLTLEDDELVLTKGNRKGLFLVKTQPERGDFLHAAMYPENEHLTMQIASSVFDISTTINALVFFSDETPAYLTRRFDVEPNYKSFQQEDFAQLKERSIKAQDYTYEDVGKLIRKYVAASGPAIIIFYRRLLFNYLFSNGDGGLGSFSIMRSHLGDYTLTPAYDLLCTKLHDSNSPDTAMDLYTGVRRSSYYLKHRYAGTAEFIVLGEKLGIPASRALLLIKAMLDKSLKAIKMVEQSFLDQESKAAYLHLFSEKLNRLTTTYP
ncbi:type II toxin-antitoxin system HipA family toxin [uncultured Chitinophaga sp.]|uniref:type II toxin-antitoxin system HipA family toxin n=1 Tax=uncultured Chitinophaga sp. TaxID=339340 RepID=UPI0025E8D936|nr:HipA domain-containing protein [uncultured Chitinophaga sp.]